MQIGNVFNIVWMNFAHFQAKTKSYVEIDLMQGWPEKVKARHNATGTQSKVTLMGPLVHIFRCCELGDCSVECRFIQRPTVLTTRGLYERSQVGLWYV